MVVQILPPSQSTTLPMLMETNNMLSLSSIFENDKLMIDKDRNAVEHKYVDHAQEKSDEVLTRLHVDTRPTAKGGVSVPFPLKLHEMLDQIEEDGLAHVISWQPHGRCFCVHKQQEFVETIMPTYFRQTKFASFQRQLNLYGFQRLTSGRDKGGYYHELFLRGKRFLCHRIQRIKIKGTGVRKASSPETEPQFYNMPAVGAGGEIEQEENAKLPAMNTALHKSLNQLQWNTNTFALGGNVPQLNLAALAQQHQQQQQLALLQSLQTTILPTAATSAPANVASLPALLQQQQQQEGQLSSLVAASSKASEWQQQLQQLQQLQQHQQLRTASAPAPASKVPSSSTEPAPGGRPVSIDDDQEFGAVLKALVKMPVEPEAARANPLAEDEQLGNLFEMLTE